MKNLDMISKLFYLITTADGTINQKELEMGKHLIKNEGLEEKKFQEDLKVLEKFSHNEIYLECLEDLKKADKEMQVHYLAWLALIANADGFMEKNEWQIIYGLYFKELKLDLQDIMVVQRDLVNKIK